MPWPGRWILGPLAVACLAAAAAGKEPVMDAPLDAPPKPDQKPYSPAVGQVVAVTPPPFLWVPAGRNVTYALQVSPTADFAGRDTKTFPGIPTTVFVPSEPLPAGRWYWRYGLQSERGVRWGRARRFTVPADAVRMAFPDFTEVVARVPKQRPRLFFPRKRLEEVRAHAAGPLAGQVASLRRRCEKALGRPLVPEPPRPRSGPEKVHVMRTTRPPMDEMEHCALLYLLTGERKYGLEAKRRLLHFFGWDPNGPTSLFSYDEPAMWMMMRGVRAYDWTAGLFEPHERRKVESVMKIRAEHFLRYLERLPFESRPYNSHAGRMPGFLGEAALCFAHEWPEAAQWLRYATLLYWTSYPAWGGDGGGWQEGPMYWGAYMSFALHYVVALREATGVDLARKPFFRNTPFYALYTAAPYQEHSPFGDGQDRPPRGLGRVLYAFSTLTQNPFARWYAVEAGFRPGGDLLSLATFDPDLHPADPAELPHGRAFPANGLAALHTALGRADRDVTFVLRSSPYGSVSHGHADQNAFFIEAFGKALALATGYYPWYGSPHHHDWTRATKAVNSILVDGAGQVRRSRAAAGRLTGFQLGASDGYDYVAGEAGRAYGRRLRRFRRKVVLIRPGPAGAGGPAALVMLDDLLATRPATFQWLLHAHQRFEIDGQVLRTARPPAAMTVHLLAPTGLGISQTDAYDPPPEKSPKPYRWADTWHLAASTKARAPAAKFLSVLLVHRAGTERALPAVAPVRTRGGLGALLTWPDGATDRVVFHDDGRTVATGRDGAGRVLRTLERSEGR